MAQAPRDQNFAPTILLESSTNPGTVLSAKGDQVTGRLLVDSAGGGGSGTVTSVSVVTANGISGSVATATTTPAITLTLGAITPTTVNGLTITANGTNTLSITAGKTLSIVKTMSFTAADDTGVYTLPTGTKTLLATDGAGTGLTGIPYTLTGTANQVVLSAGTGNITFSLPQSIATSSNPQFATLELGAASDTTISRVSAGLIAVEGITMVDVSTAQTLTNKTLTSPVLTTPSSFTTGGTITLAENTTVALDPAGSADGKFTGTSITAVAGYAQTYGDLVYLDPTDSRWELCDANSAQGADGDSRGIIGIVVVAGGSDGAACTILLQGVIRADAKFPTFTVNNPIYISETAGAVTQTQPTTTDVVIRIVGFGITTDEMYFNPSPGYITHT